MTDLEQRVSQTVSGRIALATIQAHLEERVCAAVHDGHAPSMYLAAVLRCDLVEEIAKDLGLRNPKT